MQFRTAGEPQHPLKETTMKRALVALKLVPIKVSDKMERIDDISGYNAVLSEGLSGHSLKRQCRVAKK